MLIRTKLIHILQKFRSIFSLLKCVIGTGILAMPLAFKFSGILGGIIITILCIVLLIYGIQLLVYYFNQALKSYFICIDYL